MLLTRTSPILAAALIAGLGFASVDGAWAQARGSLRGRVTDGATGRPVDGAKITMVGTTLAGETDGAGQYVIRGVPPGSYTVRAVRIGYSRLEASVTVALDQGVTSDLAMSAAAIQLDELIVTGTPGVTEQRTLGNVVSKLDAAALTEKMPTNDVQQMLLARTPGLTLTTLSGQAGASSNIKIRGAGSLAAGYRPVFYIDGIRFDAQTKTGIGTNGSTVQGSNPLDFINPDDIESVEVIKGPAASTLYGADAASGVIQIITKKGRRSAGAVQWSVGSEVGQSDWTSHIGNPTNYWLCQAAQIRDPVNSPGCVGFDSLAPASQRLLTDDPVRDVALLNGRGDTLRRPCGCTLRNGALYKADISARGGGDFFNYYLSADQYSENGVYYNNFERRVGGRANFEVTPSEKLNFSVNLSYVRNHLRMPLQDNASNGLLRNAFRGRAGGTKDPWKPGWRGFGPELADQYDNQDRPERAILGLTTSWKPLSWFQNRVTLGLDKQDRDNSEFFTIDTTGLAPWGAVQATGRIQHFMPTTHVWTADYSGTMSAKLPMSLKSAFSGGVQLNSRQYRATTITGEGLVANQLNLVGAAAVTRADEDVVKQTSLGLYLQEQLGWRERLYVTGAVRIDDNSAFGSDFKLVTYPKASLSYVISDEKFFHLPLVENLKLRAAFGEAGRAPAPFTADRTFTSDRTTLGDLSVNELRPAFYGNPALRPERGMEVELGFDGSLAKGRAGIEFTYYDQRTKDALIAVPNLRSSGYYDPNVTNGRTHFENIGEIANHGLEVLLMGTPLYGRKFAWDASLSVSTNHNELVSFGGATHEISFGDFLTVQKHKEGYPLGGYWAVDVVRDASGRPVLTNNQVTVDTTQTYIGPSSRTREASLTNTFTLFGNVRIYALLDYKGGNYLWCAICSVRNRIDQNTWEVNNPDADPTDVKVYESLQTKAFIYPADFIKLREVSVSYTLPVSWSRLFRASKVNVTVGSKNLHRWTKYKGVGDPEVNFTSTGNAANFNRTDYDATPPLQQLYAAMRITF